MRGTRRRRGGGDLGESCVPEKVLLERLSTRDGDANYGKKITSGKTGVWCQGGIEKEKPLFGLAQCE